MPPKRKRNEQADSPSASPNKKAKADLSNGEKSVVVTFKQGWNEVSIPPSVLVYVPSKEVHSADIVAFDLDSTLIKTKSGKTFPCNRSDWVWWDASVKPKLQELSKEGKKLVIITNQSKINGKMYDGQAQKEICGKIDDIIADVNLPIYVIVLTSDDEYRKPQTKSWDEFIPKINNGIQYSPTSIYVGDAAGRPDGWKPKIKHDFSCSDRKFAHNIGIKFATPEEFFLKENPAPFDWNSINPEDYLKSSKELFDKGDESTATSDKQEMIILVGFPGSGKSTFCKTYLLPKGYVHVNRDTLKTPAKCLKFCTEQIEGGKSVVIDNTNPKKADRAAYINIAKKKNIPVRCFWMSSTKEFADHLNYYRECLTEGESRHVPKIAYNIYKGSFSEPELSEGFTEIKRVNFVPKFQNNNEQKLFRQLF